MPSIKKVERLTPEQHSECSKYFPIFNEVTFEYLFSREHNFREKGVGIVNEVMN